MALAASNVYARMSSELAGGRPLSYLGKGASGAPVITSTGGGGVTNVGSAGAGGGGAVSGSSLSNIYGKLEKDYEESRAEQQRRYEQGLGELEQIAGLFGPEYGAGMEKAALTGAKQSLIGRGLGGTTRPMGVSAGLKAQFEDLRRGKIADALTRMAEYRRTSPQIYPQPSTLGTLALGSYTAVSPEQQMQMLQMQEAGALQRTQMSGSPNWPQAPVGGPSYMASTLSRAASFGGSNIGGDISSPDFTLPSIF